MSHFAPQPDIFLHGFDENFLEHIDQPIFHTSYQKYKEEKRLDELLPLKGCVIMRGIENHLLKIISQDDPLFASPFYRNYQKVWSSYMRVLGIIQEMGVRIHNTPLRTIQHRTFNKTIDSTVPKREYCTNIANNLYVFQKR